MPDPCSEFLKDGVFDVIASNTNESLEENILKFYENNSFEKYKELADAGMGITIPFKGIPIGVDGKYSQESYKSIQHKISNKEIKSVTFNQQAKFLQSTASPIIADAWLECKRLQLGGNNFDDSPGLKARLSSPSGNPSVILFEFAWVPNNIEDFAPVVNGFQITGASIADGANFGTGSEIPFGGGTLLLTREGKSAVTVTLNTSKGDFSSTVDALDEPIKNLQIRIDGLKQIGSKLRFESLSEGGEIDSYSWNFGDGNSASGRVVEHTYTQVKDFVVKLAVANSIDEEFNSVSVKVDFPPDFLLYGQILFFKLPKWGKWLNGGRGKGNEIVTTRNELADPNKRSAYEWIIAKNESVTGSGSVRYGDTVYLQVRNVSKWLNGGRGRGNEIVTTRNELENSITEKRSAYEWVIQKQPS